MPALHIPELKLGEEATDNRQHFVADIVGFCAAHEESWLVEADAVGVGVGEVGHVG